MAASKGVIIARTTFETVKTSNVIIL